MTKNFPFRKKGYLYSLRVLQLGAKYDLLRWVWGLLQF